MTLSYLNIVLGIALVTGCAAEVERVRPAVSDEGVLTWDFRRSRDVALVPWPEPDEQGRRPLFHHIRPTGPVRLRFPGGLEFCRRVELLTFSRGDDDRLEYIYFSLEKQSADDAYATAVELGRRWRLPVEKLEPWIAAARRGELNAVSLVRNDLEPARALEIFKTLNDERPVAITLQAGWLD